MGVARCVALAPAPDRGADRRLLLLRRVRSHPGPPRDAGRAAATQRHHRPRVRRVPQRRHRAPAATPASRAHLPRAPSRHRFAPRPPDGAHRAGAATVGGAHRGGLAPARRGNSLDDPTGAGGGVDRDVPVRRPRPGRARQRFQADSGGGPGGFYDEQGRSLKRAFLRAPLQFRRVSSRFGSRFHPILHEWRIHEGTDYAAAYGTPVRATADGIVTRLGRESGYGNLLELRHANGIRTRYGHLSAYAKGLLVGQRVGQGETIAYVGSTGLSTGPHLHYEFIVNGRPTNPLRKDAGEGVAVPKSLKAAYDAARALLLAQLEPHPAHVAARVD
ncbi:MAG: hypothetical protein DMD74_07015 [Gemmatimonadetes bacterium]|nr:MAG: hypothetical protein DMD74_07015 [Gemmatimonadota bacterium]